MTVLSLGDTTDDQTIIALVKQNSPDSVSRLVNFFQSQDAVLTWTDLKAKLVSHLKLKGFKTYKGLVYGRKQGEREPILTYVLDKIDLITSFDSEASDEEKI